MNPIAGEIHVLLDLSEDRGLDVAAFRSALACLTTPAITISGAGSVETEYVRGDGPCSWAEMFESSSPNACFGNRDSIGAGLGVEEVIRRGHGTGSGSSDWLGRGGGHGDCGMIGFLHEISGDLTPVFDEEGEWIPS